MNVKLNISDKCCSKCFTKEKVLQPVITGCNQTIDILCDYILNVIYVDTKYITVILQNDNNVIIRNIYYSFPLIISLPCKDCTHILTISVTL